MTPENIAQLKKDFDTLEKAISKRSNVYSVIKHLGKEGRNGQIGVYQNSYNCQIQIALQYTTGGTNYWSDSELNKEFAKTIEMNFESLMSQTIQRVDSEYQEAQAAFYKYEVKETKQWLHYLA